MASEMSSSMQSRRLGPHGTPESEFSIECFQNYTSPEVFVQGLAGIVNQGDVESMIRAQKQMLQRFEKTNEMLVNCNALSASRLKTAGEDFKKHIKLLQDMKKDLDYIYRKIRNIKQKVSTQYPDAYAEAQPQRSSFAEEAEDDEEAAIKAKTLQATATVEAEKKPPQKKAPKSHATIGYVQMKQSPENGEDKRRSLRSTHSSSTDNSNNSNDSSDCTSDTG